MELIHDVEEGRRSLDTANLDELDRGNSWRCRGRPRPRRMNIAFGGRTVVVTGAAHGFGRAIAVAFAQNGARVMACDVNAAELPEDRRGRRPRPARPSNST